MSISASTKKALQEAAGSASENGDASGRFRDLASPEVVLDLIASLDAALSLVDRATLPCLFCGDPCVKGNRIIRGAGTWCSMLCAESDGEAWAQK